MDDIQPDGGDEQVLPEASPEETSQEQNGHAADANEPDHKSEAEKMQKLIARERRKIAKLTAIKYQQAEELKELRAKLAPQNPQQNSGEPKESDYDTYADYISALNSYRIEQKFAEYDGKQKHMQQEQANIMARSKNEQVVEQASQKFIKETPDALAVLQEYADVADEFPAEIEQLFLEAGEGAPVAFYNLAKEGKLESLSNMSLMQAAIEIGRAAAQPIKKPVTKAPTPISAAKGTASLNKDLYDLPAEEIVRRLTS